MSARWQEAEPCREGTALVVKDDQGARLELGYHELPIAPWHASSEPPCIKSVQLAGGALLVQTSQGDHRIELSDLEARAKSTLVLHNTSFVMTCDGEGLGLVAKGAVVVVGDRIAWVGTADQVESCALDLGKATRIDLGGRLLTPGLIDCHAHPLFAGRRAAEFERRARGDHYREIAKEGGGINATVEPTRSASISEHVGLCGRRMQQALAWGTTTMEAKSGYDLSVEGELRLLRIANMVDALQPVDLVPTLLGAHALPKEYASDREGFIKSVCEEMIPRAAQAGLATAVDVYCDEGAFTLAETRRILTRAKTEGLEIKAHIGQFADLGGAQLLAELAALSGDHLEQVSEEGLAAMASASVVATMLPGACVQLKMQPPPVAGMRKAGVKMALASDLNPGTSHSETLTLPMWLATTHFGMTVEEAWLGVTTHAATALGGKHIDSPTIGKIKVGMQADLVAWDAELPAEIPYHFGVNLVHAVVKKGKLV